MLKSMVPRECLLVELAKLEAQTKPIRNDGVVAISDTGTGQGSVASPLLSNVYLHYVFDLWAERWRRREASGDMIIVRYADDIIVGFQYEIDARRFWDAMRERLGNTRYRFIRIRPA
jgi:retron-type reverse transcriptase